MLILYAEDDIDDYDFFIEILDAIIPGQKCLNARNGQELLDLLESLFVLPDIIFLDINMPNLDGKACLKAIKTDARFKEIPVIVYTTSTSPKDEQHCLQLGASRYMRKPFSKIEAEKMLSETLREFSTR
jgi:CheY-like chemotaxis protein